MIEPVQGVALVASVFLLGLVLELVRRRLLVEEYAFVWLGLSVGLGVLAVKREILHGIAARLGVHYPPAVLLLFLAFLGFVVALHFSVVISAKGAPPPMPALAATKSSRPKVFRTSATPATTLASSPTSTFWTSTSPP